MVRSDNDRIWTNEQLDERTVNKRGGVQGAGHRRRDRVRLHGAPRPTRLLLSRPIQGAVPVSI